MRKTLLSCILTAICSMAGAQDLIVLRNTQEILVKILKVSTTEVECRKKENPKGPIYTFPISDIQYIQYKNGTKEVFAKAPSTTLQTKTIPGWPPRTSRYIFDKIPPDQDPKIKKAERKLWNKIRYGRLGREFPYYQGSLDLAYSFSTNGFIPEYNILRLAIETIHGVRLNPYLFVGAGVSILARYDQQIKFEGSGKTLIPLFANVKGYYPFSRRFSFYLSLDLGTTLHTANQIKGTNTQLYTTIGPGITYGQIVPLDISIRYQHLGRGILFGRNAIVVRFGLGF